MSNPGGPTDAQLAALSASLSPLPYELDQGLVPVTFFGMLSFVTATLLFLLLTYRMIRWQRKSRRINQFIILIWNLLLADIQQSMAFLLNVHWLINDEIKVKTSTCWAQGWFVSTGDLASGVWSFAIGLHTFAVVIFGYRLSNVNFAIAIFLLWTFVYVMAIAGVALHPQDIYVRAVAWCWVNAKYGHIRLWLHYFWIFAFEFGTVLIYGILIVALRWRLKSGFYSQQQKRHAKDAAKLMIAYPAIYVFCTLPLATLRMYQETTTGKRVSATWFCFAGAMITSNGWLDVILYCVTRRIMLFSDDPPTDNGIETFRWVRRDVFGTETTCEHVPASGFQSRKASLENGQDSDTIYMVDKPFGQTADGDPYKNVTITTERTVEVTTSVMTDAQRKALEDGYAYVNKTRHPWSSESEGSDKGGDEITRPATPTSIDYSSTSLDFQTRPTGL